MAWRPGKYLKKAIKSVGRGIKKVGKRIGKAFKKVLKPFAKIFNKLGPIGTIAMSMLLPGIGTALAGWGAGMGNVVGTMIKFVGNAIHYVSTAPQKLFGTITDALGASWNTLTGAAQGTWKPGSWFDNFSTTMNERIAGDGWFGGKSGSWASFDTTGGILPSGAPLTGEGQGSVIFDEATNTWMEAGPKGTMGKPLSKANIDYMNAQAAPVVPDLVSDGTVSMKGTDFDSYPVDTVTGTKLKLDSTGTPIPLEKGATGYPSLISKTRSAGQAFRQKHDDKFWAGSLGLNAYQAYNTFAGTEDIRGGGGGAAFSFGELTADADQNNMYNKPAPTWDPSFMNNILAGASSWNQHYGLPAGFDPNQTPGFGFTWDEWMRTQGGTA